MLYARVKRAGVPHAILTRIDVEQARQLPGVVAVLIADDIPGERNHGVVVYDWPTMVGVGERVRYIGDAVAIVAAETPEAAAQALELIDAGIRTPGSDQRPGARTPGGRSHAARKRQHAQTHQGAQGRYGAQVSKTPT